ncbi:MAG: SAM-dependent chlorinase/fluorinase [Chloroflexia bacterium]|nr:SAM-dependent chlorinase/fluorinase [Chloroflexia bacterium]
MITLLTDFGLSDVYVGVLKGVIWGICPQARIVDLTHNVRPQDVLQGGFLLASCYRHFPRGTVHLAVVDPGVGTDRPAIAMETPYGWFVAPDNGLLIWVWEGLSRSERAASRIVELGQSRYWLPQVSRTFHGRDIFAPVAAHLAAGVSLEELGRPLRQLTLQGDVQPRVQDDGTVLGHVLHVDRFGNCSTNIEGDDVKEMAAEGSLCVDLPGHRLEGLHSTYAQVQPGQPLALIGSNGRLEIAVRNGSAAAQLGLAVGDPVRVWMRRT